MFHSELIVRALEFSARAHEGQYRKSEAKVPYFSHCAAVGIILQKAEYREEVVAAGILHDVLEDTPITRKELRDAFGEEVYVLVDLVTELEKTHPWEARKEAYRKRLESASEEARAISAADKLHNISTMLAAVQEGEPIFDRMSRGPADQIAQWESLFETLARDGMTPLLRELGLAIETAKRELGP